MSPTDPGLDERVCRKLGWEPIRIEWTEVGSAKGGIPYGIWPPVSASWEWAGKALEELSKRFFVEVTSWNQGGFGFWTVEIDSRELAGEKTGPLAIARAIDAALPEVEG